MARAESITFKEFRTRFSTEEICRAELFRLRFPNGFVCPKPLIEINGKPFFYWAARSVEKFVDCADLTFVVLEEHIRDFAIDEKIKAYWPAAGAEGLRGPARR